MERYENVIARPLEIRGRAAIRKRRRPRAPAALAAALRAQGEEMFDAAVAHGLVAPDGEDNDEMLNGVDDTPIADGAGSAEVRAEAVGEEDLEADGREGVGAASADTRTKAEREFAEIAERRERERLRRQAGLTHKQQIDKFNKALAAEPEHYDLFRVSHTK
jgi:hypothetical protein